MPLSLHKTRRALSSEFEYLNPMSFLALCALNVVLLFFLWSSFSGRFRSSLFELLAVRDVAVVLVADLVDVVVGAGAGWAARQGHVALLLPERELRVCVQLREAVLFIVAGVGVAAN